MQRQELIQLLIESVSDYFKEQSIDSEVNESTPLFGSASQLDSMGLVHVIVDIESRLREHNINVSLISEQAMSQRNSPFRTISTLADFILTQVA
jgi:acyl carrier protein